MLGGFKTLSMRLKFVSEALFFFYSHKKNARALTLNRLHVERGSLKTCGYASVLAFHHLSLINNLVIHRFSLYLRFKATRDPKEVVDLLSTVALLWNVPEGLKA